MKPYIAIPAIAALVYRAYSRKSLTPEGIFTALLVAVVHAVHPWSVCFAMLAVFFLGGTTATKVCYSLQDGGDLAETEWGLTIWGPFAGET